MVTDWHSANAEGTMSFIPRVLIVDEDPARDAFAQMLPHDRYVCEVASSAAHALRTLDQLTFDIVIVEVRLDGFALLGRLRSERPNLPVILLSATGRVQEAVDAIKGGAFHYLTKPCDEADLRTAVDAAVAARR